jgi:hypothetical protein
LAHTDDLPEVPDGRHVVVTDSSHYIHIIKPSVVIDAITDLVEASLAK